MKRSHLFPLSSKLRKEKNQVVQLSDWITEMALRSRELMNVLSRTVRTWDEFRQNKLSVFLYDADMTRTDSPLLNLPLGNIENAFSELRLLEGHLQLLHKELSVDCREAVSFLFSVSTFIDMQINKCEHFY
jgi:hypothetical protein